VALGVVEDISVTFVNDLHATVPKVRGYGFSAHISPSDPLPMDWTPALQPGYHAGGTRRSNN